jgi:3-hydroxyisobutyrate dehydrogenase-like beta-hydroxyacid dehydrogenase
MKVGVVGLGRMGSAMAARMIAAGHDLTVYDAVESQTAALASQGARVARSLADLCADREVVLSMLPTDEIFEAVVIGPGGLADSLPKGAVHMVSGTHGLPLVERLAEVHQAAGQILLAANVLGRPERAATGSLGFITGGPADVVQKVQPLLAVMGSSFIHAGETPAAAVVCKLANSFVLGCAIEATGEGVALVRKYGVRAEVFYHVLTDGLFDCVAYHAYGDVIAKEDWGRVGATVTIGLKDTDLAFEAAGKVAVPLPSGVVYREHLIAAQAHGESELDWSVMAREQFRRSGLE